MTFLQTIGWYFCGLGVTLWVGHHAVGSFLAALRGKSFAKVTTSGGKVPAWLTGAVERFFFAMLVAFNLDGIAPTMMGWLGLKLASNWNHPDYKHDISGAFGALITGALSMLFALAGGLIIRRGME